MTEQSKDQWDIAAMGDHPDGSIALQQALLHKAPVFTIWRHVKTRRLYRIVGHALIESTGRPGILYEAVFGARIGWVRDADEFLDGRFTPDLDGDEATDASQADATHD